MVAMTEPGRSQKAAVLPESPMWVTGDQIIESFSAAIHGIIRALDQK